jgi:hypothetical protein
MIFVALDIDYNYDSAFKTFLAENDIEIVKYIENGPAGGNPYYELNLEPDQLIKFTKFYTETDLSTYSIVEN